MSVDGTPVALNHRVDGDPTAPAVLLGPAVGLALSLWDPQVEALAEHWRVIRFDTRGHGGSPAPPGPYSIPELANDVLALADDLGVDQFAYCGVSLGGAIGQQLQDGIERRKRPESSDQRQKAEQALAPAAQP